MTRLQPRYKPGDKIGGRYQVHQVKMGGMGEVYLCLDLKENYPYALKTFQQRYQSATLRKAFEEEVATWVALEKHPNIVRCFYMDILDNQPFMVLEWIAGEEGKGADLRGWLRRGPLDLKTALEIIIDVVHGLVHAQEKQLGLVHRDLKPENILVAQGGLAKITDFGLAQIVEQAGLEFTKAESEAKAEGRQSLVRKGCVAGTPAYMAPEQWRGEALDERTDIYAVGCILYELLTGQGPFRVDFNPTTPQQMKQWLATMRAMHESGLVAALPITLPIEINRIVQGCLAKKLADRLGRPAELLTHLEEIYHRQFGEPPKPTPHKDKFTHADYNNRGMTYNSLQRYNNALADLNQAIQLDPDDAAAYLNRGITYSGLQQYDNAFRDTSRAIQLNPEEAGAYFNRGAIYQSLNEYEKAIADYDQTIQIDPNFTEAYNNRGSIYYNLNSHQEALDNYNAAIRLDPVLAKPYYSRGNVYADLGQYDLAFIDYDLAIRLDPSNAEAYYNRGNAYADIERDKDAVADYSLAINLDSTLMQAYINRGKIYTKLQQYDEALVDYTRAIELKPAYPRSYFNRGLIYSTLEKYQKALIDFDQALQLDPNDAMAYNIRGNTYVKLKQPKEAVNDYLKAIELEPNFSHPYFNIGRVLYDRGKFYEALPYFQKATQLGESGGEQAVTQTQQILAFETFEKTKSVDEIREAVTELSFMTSVDFISTIEQSIIQQVPPEHRPHFEQRLGWLKQIAQEQNQ